jgi:hypothetical protein
MTTGYNPPGGSNANATELQSVPISPTPPTTGQGLVYNGTEWIPAASSGNATEIQGIAVSGTAPTVNQGLVYQGGQWVPANVVNTLTGVGAGLTIAGSASNVLIQNTGVTSAVAGAGISVSAATGAVTIANTGVTSAVAGTGIVISPATGAVSINNSGVLSVAAGTAISVTGAANSPVVNNTGVTSAVAGDNITVSGPTGAVTISANTPAAQVNLATSTPITTTGANIVTTPALTNSKQYLVIINLLVQNTSGTNYIVDMLAFAIGLGAIGGTSIPAFAGNFNSGTFTTLYTIPATGTVQLALQVLGNAGITGVNAYPSSVTAGSGFATSIQVFRLN